MNLPGEQYESYMGPSSRCTSVSLQPGPGPDPSSTLIILAAALKTSREKKRSGRFDEFDLGIGPGEPRDYIMMQSSEPKGHWQEPDPRYLWEGVSCSIFFSVHMGDFAFVHVLGVSK